MISAVCSPFLGGLVDVIGRRANLLLLSTIVLASGHATFAFTSSTNLNNTLSLILVFVIYKFGFIFAQISVLLYIKAL